MREKGGDLHTVSKQDGTAPTTPHVPLPFLHSRWIIGRISSLILEMTTLYDRLSCKWGMVHVSSPKAGADIIPFWQAAMIIKTCETQERGGTFPFMPSPLPACFISSSSSAALRVYPAPRTAPPHTPAQTCPSLLHGRRKRMVNGDGDVDGQW